MNSPPSLLPRGIVPVVQTAFTASGELDLPSIQRLVVQALNEGANGLLVPAVASEVAYLSAQERRQIVAAVLESVQMRVPVILGASADTPQECIAIIKENALPGVAAALVAVPQPLYGQKGGLREFFTRISGEIEQKVIIQDFQFNGHGLSLEALADLNEVLPNLGGLKIETAPAGPKYTSVREAFGSDFWIAGGWAVPQMIEAMDRGVDAMVPESSMVLGYRQVWELYSRNDRVAATRLFREILPILAFTNQEVSTSVAFFKRLLLRRRCFTSACQRMPLAGWDAQSERTAAELIDHYIDLEKRLRSSRATKAGAN